MIVTVVMCRAPCMHQNEGFCTLDRIILHESWSKNDLPEDFSKTEMFCENQKIPIIRSKHETIFKRKRLT